MPTYIFSKSDVAFARNYKHISQLDTINTYNMPTLSRIKFKPYSKYLLQLHDKTKITTNPDTYANVLLFIIHSPLYGNLPRITELTTTVT